MEVDLSKCHQALEQIKKINYMILYQYLPPVPRAHCAQCHWLAQPHFRSHWSDHLSLRRLSGVISVQVTVVSGQCRYLEVRPEWRDVFFSELVQQQH